MIVVYRVLPDVDRFRSFLLADRAQVLSYFFDCTPIAHWDPPRVIERGHDLEEGDFWGFNANTSSFVAGPHALELAEVRSILELAGQLLPLPYGGRTFGLLNVTVCINALDDEHTSWEIGRRTGQRIMIDLYAFHPDRFTESTLIKIPESQAILCYEAGNPAVDFKAIVERLGLTGLLFTEVWRSGGD